MQHPKIPQRQSFKTERAWLFAMELWSKKMLIIAKKQLDDAKELSATNKIVEPASGFLFVTSEGLKELSTIHLN